MDRASWLVDLAGAPVTYPTDDGRRRTPPPKVGTSLTELNGTAAKIGTALAAHNSAVKRLATGRGNVLSLDERIRALGVCTKRSMPTTLVDGASISPPDDAAENGANQLPNLGRPTSYRPRAHYGPIAAAEQEGE